MKAYLSFLPGPRTFEADYVNVVEGTPYNENAWEHVALYETRRVLGEAQPMRPGYRAADRMLLAEFGRATDEARAAMAESLASFLSAETEI